MRNKAVIFIILAFTLDVAGPLPVIQASPSGGLASPLGGEFVLPAPGTMVNLSKAFNPPIFKGLKVHPDNPFRFDFILDQGDSALPTRGHVPLSRDVSPGTLPNESTAESESTPGKSPNDLKQEANKLIKYFLASLTIPEKDLWVNLSPYEKNRIIPDAFGQTEMGRDLLAEDYMLKQITSSLIYPEGETGKKFWKKVYAEAAKRFGTTNIPVNTFNKVWIVPEKAVVYENAKAGTAYVVESTLKVMLEEDYLSQAKHGDVGVLQNGDSPVNIVSQGTVPILKGSNIHMLGSQMIREIVIPELTKEVNIGANFAQLRQVYNSLILATWYKKKIKDSILTAVYANKNKIQGITITTPGVVEVIYQRYLRAFKKGAYNLIKEETDPVTHQPIPRKYFSGGAVLDLSDTFDVGVNKAMMAEVKQGHMDQVTVDFEDLNDQGDKAMNDVGYDSTPVASGDKISTESDVELWTPGARVENTTSGSKGTVYHRFEPASGAYRGVKWVTIQWDYLDHPVDYIFSFAKKYFRLTGESHLALVPPRKSGIFPEEIFKSLTLLPRYRNIRNMESLNAGQMLHAMHIYHIVHYEGLTDLDYGDIYIPDFVERGETFPSKRNTLARVESLLQDTDYSGDYMRIFGLIWRQMIYDKTVLLKRNHDNLGNLIWIARQYADKSNRYLFEETGMTVQKLSVFQSNVVVPTPGEFYAIMRVLRVTEDTLISFGRLESAWQKVSGEAESPAMTARHTGGIDLTQDKAMLVRNNGQDIVFHLDPAMLKRWMHSSGLALAKVQIQPLRNIRAFLGL